MSFLWENTISWFGSYVVILLKKQCADEALRNERLMIRDAVLIASNSMLRVGELWQLKWNDIVAIETRYDEQENEL